MSETIDQPKAEQPEVKKSVPKGTGPKTVYLRRKPLEGYLPKEVRAEARYTLSSILHMNQPLKGLTAEEEEKYLPSLLPVGPKDPRWAEHVRNFWAEMRIRIGFTGTPLEIGTNEETGAPLNLMDWVRWKFALKHKLVAQDEKEMMSSPIKQCYILDPTKEVAVQNIKVQQSMLADREFIKLSENPEALRSVLQVMSPAIRITRLKDDEVQNALFELKTKDPKKFVETVGDKDLLTRAEIYRMIAANVILKLNDTYSFRNDVIGNSETELLLWFKSPKSTVLVNAMRQALIEAGR